eukprot:SAG22_NODE_85_length_21510_cov_6.472187_3_plen_218_part_00
MPTTAAAVQKTFVRNSLRASASVSSTCPASSTRCLAFSPRPKLYVILVRGHTPQAQGCFQNGPTTARQASWLLLVESRLTHSTSVRNSMATVLNATVRASPPRVRITIGTATRIVVTKPCIRNRLSAQSATFQLGLSSLWLRPAAMVQSSVSGGRGKFRSKRIQGHRGGLITDSSDATQGRLRTFDLTDEREPDYIAAHHQCRPLRSSGEGGGSASR